MKIGAISEIPVASASGSHFRLQTNDPKVIANRQPRTICDRTRPRETRKLICLFWFQIARPSIGRNEKKERISAI